MRDVADLEAMCQEHDSIPVFRREGDLWEGGLARIETWERSSNGLLLILTFGTGSEDREVYMFALNRLLEAIGNSNQEGS